MSGKVSWSEEELVISEDVEDFFRKEISSFGTGTHIVCPKEHEGKTAYVIICKE